MFEGFNTLAMYISIEVVLSLYANGRTKCLQPLILFPPISLNIKVAL